MSFLFIFVANFICDKNLLYGNSLFMTLAINITDECGLSNKAHHELLVLLKKDKVVLFLPFIFSGKSHLTSCTRQTEHFSFKSGRAMCL